VIFTNPKKHTSFSKNDIPCFFFLSLLSSVCFSIISIIILFHYSLLSILQNSSCFLFLITNDILSFLVFLLSPSLFILKTKNKKTKIFHTSTLHFTNKKKSLHNWQNLDVRNFPFLILTFSIYIYSGFLVFIFSFLSSMFDLYCSFFFLVLSTSLSFLIWQIN